MTGEISAALKEWQGVCRALARGRQCVLLRKGGIYEAGGEFEVEHRRFVLFPTWLHQSPRMVRADFHADLEIRTDEPARIPIAAAAEVERVIPLRTRSQMDAIRSEHIWTDTLIDMRFAYRPENPLYLLVVRVWNLPEAVELENTPAYAGCKSWVPLELPIRVDGAAPAMPDEEFGLRLERICEAVGS